MNRRNAHNNKILSLGKKSIFFDKTTLYCKFKLVSAIETGRKGKCRLLHWTQTWFLAWKRANESRQLVKWNGIRKRKRIFSPVYKLTFPLKWESKKQRGKKGKKHSKSIHKYDTYMLPTAYWYQCVFRKLKNETEIHIVAANVCVYNTTTSSVLCI